MGRSLSRLSAVRFAKLTKQGRYCDGGGLYLQINKEGARSWIYRFQIGKRVRDMGLGPASVIGLADARDFAAQCRALVARRIDPIEERIRRQQQEDLAAASTVTFDKCALEVLEAKRLSWRNKKHGDQWESTLRTYAFPFFGDLPVGEITTELVLKALRPIWATKIETAGRVRERIECVLDAAKARGLREGDNPARWRGHLETLLAKPSKLKQVRHHPALPYIEISRFMIELRARESMAARALELLVLTATRTSEVLGATWSEFDLGSKVWAIPAVRMKGGKEHRVPLSDPVIHLVSELHKHRVSEFVFPGLKVGRPLSNMAMLMLLERMNYDHVTAHGFRSTFRDWCAEETNFSREVAEMALAHSIQSKVEAAYRRGGLFEKRTKLMAAWASYCSNGIKGEVILYQKSA